MKTDDTTPQLLEIYKFYVELTDRISQRRGQANNFFLSIISSFIALIGFVSPFINIANKETSIYFICILGILLCLVWHININSYKQLAKIKFMVIQEIEQNLQFQCYTREWQLLKENKIKYFRLTKTEKFIPLLFTILFIVVVIINIILN